MGDFGINAYVIIVDKYMNLSIRVSIDMSIYILI